MSKEHDQLVASLNHIHTVKEGVQSYVEGILSEHQLVLGISGIGKVNAAATAVEMIRLFHPDVMINTGVAGGVDTSLAVMDVVVGQRTIYHDVDCGPDTLPGQLFEMPQYYEADKALYEAAMQVKTETRLHGGLICTGDQFITNHAQLSVIKQRFPKGLAVDMESCALAQVCYLYKIPFLSFRIISDTPGVENHMDQYLNFWDEMATRSFGVTRALLNAITELKMTKA